MELIFIANLEEDHARIIRVKFHQNPNIGLLEVDLVNLLTNDGRTNDGQATA